MSAFVLTSPQILMGQVDIVGCWVWRSDPLTGQPSGRVVHAWDPWTQLSMAASCSWYYVH